MKCAFVINTEFYIFDDLSIINDENYFIVLSIALLMWSFSAA